MLKHSIIIPAGGRRLIQVAIQSVLRLDVAAHAAELIVVDNIVSDELSAELQAYCESLSGRVRYVKEPSPGLSAARHCGAAEAQGEWLTFLDDDVDVSEGWLGAVQRAFLDSSVAMVGGPSVPKFTGSIPAWFWDFMAPTPYGGWMCGWLSLLDIGKDVKNIDPNFVWGLNFSLRKSVMEECGGFHPDLVPKRLQRWQGDGETGLTRKVKAGGFRVDYVHKARVLHWCGPDRLTVEYLQQRAYYQGVCDSYTALRHGAAVSTLYPSDRPSTIWQQVRKSISAIRKSFWQRNAHSRWEHESARVKALTDAAHKEGWLFHRRQVADDPTLLAWVRRKTYFDADIREQPSYQDFV